MDFEALENAWRSNANAPDAAAQSFILQQANATLARRRARLRRVLLFAGAVLAGLAALIVYTIASGRGAELVQQWTLIPLALAPMLVLALVVMRARLQRPDASTSLRESFRALLEDNAAARMRIHVIGAAMLVFAPLMAVALNQLAASGRMAAHEMQSAALVLGGALALSAAWMAVKYAARLVPERRRLQALLRQYDEV